MNLVSLDYFLAVAKFRSFTKAASAVSVSQQGLSKSIKLLERELGFQLFERTGKLVRLTSAGSEFLPAAKSALRSYNKMWDEAHRISATRSEARKPINVLASPFVSLRVLSTLKNAHEMRGGGKFIVLEAGTEEAVAAMRKAPATSIAMANVFPDKAPCEGDVAFEPLFSIESMIMASPKLISPKTKRITKDVLRGVPLAYYNESMFNESTKRIIDHYRIDSIAAHLSSMEALLEMARTGEAVVVTDTLSAYLHNLGRENDDGVMFFPMEAPIVNNIGFLRVGTVDLEAPQQDFVKAMGECIASEWANYVKRHPPVLR